MRRVCVLGFAAAVGCGDDAPAADAAESTGGDATDVGSSDTSTADDPTVHRDDTTTTSGEPDVPTTFPGEGPFGAGARLHPVVEAAGDEHRLMHWYDSELGIECELLRDASGDLRCLPFMPSHLTAGFSTTGCSDAVLRVQSCGTAPAYVRSIAPESAACLEGLRYLTYRTAAPRSSVAEVFEYRPWWNECSSTGPAPGIDYDLDRVDDEMFARAHWVVESRGGGLGVRGIVGEDGSWQRVELYDETLDTVCDPNVWQDEDGEVRLGCVPRVPDIVVRGYGDLVCGGNELLGVPQDGTCLPTAVVLADFSTWMRLGDVHDDVAYEFTADEYCIPYDEDANLAFHRQGSTFALAPVDIEHVPVARSSDARLVPYGIGFGDDAIVVTGMNRGYGAPGGRWYDTLLESSCSPILTDDGRRVCVPGLDHGPADDDVLWGDPACSEIELRLVIGTVAPMIGFTRQGGCVPQLEALRNVVGTFDGPVFRIDPDSAECVAEELPDFGTVVQLGNVPDLEVLATLDVLTLSP